MCDSWSFAYESLDALSERYLKGGSCLLLCEQDEGMPDLRQLFWTLDIGQPVEGRGLQVPTFCRVFLLVGLCLSYWLCLLDNVG